MSSNLSHFSISKIHVPVGRIIGDSMCHYEAFRMVVLRLETTDGLVGWGFGEKSYGGHFAKEAAWNRPLAAVAELNAEFAKRFWPVLHGRPATGIKLSEPAETFAGDDAIALATRMALWDLIGKSAGLPLFRLLGGDQARESVPTYSSACEFQQPDEFLREFYGARRAEGFSMFKIKIGHPDPQHDLRRLLIVRETIGEKASLAADANKAWTPQETIDRITAFNAAGVNLAYIEDPLDPTDIEGHCLLAKSCPVPVVGHDYCRSHHDVLPLLETGALAMLRARDGLDYALGLLPMARKFQRPLIATNTVFEWNIHFAQAFPNEVDRIEFSSQRWNEIPETPVKIENGRMAAPNRPGHGFDPKADVLKEWQVRD